tara:strand:+ start:336 stop:452 length:117 start_codon:yes stop_codon:yes gene_type:complete
MTNLSDLIKHLKIIFIFFVMELWAIILVTLWVVGIAAD